MTLVHVQQRSGEETLWNLTPSFVLNVQQTSSAIAVWSVGQWQCGKSMLEREAERRTQVMA